MKDYPLDRRCDTFTQERFVREESQAKVELTIDGKHYTKILNLDRLVAEKLGSINSSDDVISAIISGEVLRGSYKEHLLLEARRIYIRRIFSSLADAISDDLESNDKVNGYDK